MHLRPINPADRPPAATPPIGGVHAAGTASSVSGVAGVSGVPAVRPVSPADEGTAGRSFDPSRTGVDLSALLRAGADQLVPREQPGAVELAAVLERARAALVRGNPGDTLAALDEAWDGAMRTEGGWYYRAAALALLGLPGEAERVLGQALIPRGGSIALLFLQSVVRSGMSDSPGARDALASALARSPAEPVLQAWNAVLAARAGDRAGALQLLASVPVSEQTSTLLSWARQAVTSATLEAARASVQSNQSNQSFAASAPLSIETLTSTPTPLQQALQSVGARLAHGALVDVRQDVRALLRAVSTGGTFDQSSRPESLAAVRSVLAAVLGVIATENSTLDSRAMYTARTDPNGRWHVSPEPHDVSRHPASAPAVMRSALLTALRTGDTQLADALLAKLPASESTSIVEALRHVAAGARSEVATSHLDEPTHVPRSELPVQSSVARLADQLITPVRIGLSLLLAQSQRAEANAALHGELSDRSVVLTLRNGAEPVSSLHASLQPSLQSSLTGAGGPGAAATAMPFEPAAGAAAALAASAAGIRQPGVAGVFGTTGAPGTSMDGDTDSGSDVTTLSDSFQSGKRLRALALGCMALAFAAMIYGYGAAAIALAGGASWLALRSSTVAAEARRAARHAAQEETGH